MVSKSKIKVRYAETDQMGVVHHSNYAVWYELARTDYIETLGITYKAMEEVGLLVPIINLQSKYIKPAFYDNTLIIETRIKKLLKVKIEFEYKIYREGEEQPINTATTVHAFVNKALKPINLKKESPTIYTKLEQSLEY
ncbi:acyl-CoA thioester hydrolase [Natranaerovirga hydrolytica]|uniref:Acyl-CoA thioester hydrolase n=1 Tax=Natranaerovirga hydrolytica TaxID=680378 RepID=A0A4R1MQE2_9FIRM|nr:thioesterase family protein [Natranaerovirga hydrolytica]TCK92749.1 acyl-CoA thioester hydrolase [Natranaerovirga hydrolytica]